MIDVDLIGDVICAIIGGIVIIGFCVFIWRKALITAFRESTVEGLLCIFPLYAIYYLIKRDQSQLTSPIGKFMEAGAARNAEAAYAYWSPQYASKEEITELIRSSYDDVFAGYKRLPRGVEFSIHQGEDITTAEVYGDIIYTSSSGAIIRKGSERQRLKASLVKENDVWKITSIRIGLTEVLLSSIKGTSVIS